MKWFFFFLAFFLARVLQLCLLYFVDSPTGGAYVNKVSDYFPYALILEASCIASISVFFGIVSRIFSKNSLLVRVLALCCGVLYLLFSAGNDEVLRWMGQHLTFSFLFTYSDAVSDLNLVSKIFVSGFSHFILEIACIVCGTLAGVLAVFFCKKQIGGNKVSVALVLTGIAISVFGYGFGKSITPRYKAYVKLAPVVFHMVSEFAYSFSHLVKPDDYKLGVEYLGGDTSKEYPFFHYVANEKKNIQDFSEKPLDEKPDIIFLTIESFRGWALDPREERVCKLMPNYCALVKSGVYFPYAYSVSFPSIEGFMGINAGLWTHPEKSFLSDYRNTRFITLPEILKNAGYYRIMLSAVNPKFDQLQGWSMQWYDYQRHLTEKQNDVLLASLFSEIYRNRPKDKPLFLNWLSISTHAPFFVPQEFTKLPRLPKQPEARYELTLAFLDKALGMLMEEIKNDDRAKNTLIVIQGDHAIPTNKMAKHYEYGSHAGYVWIPMAIIGPGLPENKILEHKVSQADLAPTILKLLGLEVSNNFVGKDMLDSTKSNAIVFRLGDVAVFSDSLCYYTQLDNDEMIVESYVKPKQLERGWLIDSFVNGNEVSGNYKEEQKKIKAAAKAWRWILDNDLLVPKEYK